MKKTIALLLVALQFNILHSQQTFNTDKDGLTPKITMPSPESFSFTRYGDIPVGLFTGSMNFSIPLGQINSGKLTVPLSLDYASNGIKVDGVAGRTGMDWNLKIGGVITRNILGKPDNGSALYAPPTSDSSSWLFFNYLKYVGTNNINTQPDEFTYSFLGQSGKFYFDYNGNVKELSPSGMKISSNASFDFFKITAQDGTQYYFTTGDDTYSYSLYGENNPLNNSDGGRTSWYLTKIKNIYGDSIVYVYNYINNVNTPISYVSGINQIYKGVSNVGPDHTNFQVDYIQSGYCAPPLSVGTAEIAGNNSAVGTYTDVRITAMNSVVLSEIRFKTGKFIFYYSSRLDLPGEQKLDSIDLISKFTNNRVKSYGFNYVYSQSSGNTTPIFNNPDLQISYPYLTKRLYLDKVIMFDKTKSKSTSYQFEYNAINDLPPRLSFSQDFFGFFNGKTNTYFTPTNTQYQNRIWLNGIASNRSIDTMYSKLGLLTKIIYPTGGYSKINYESNYLAN